MQTNGIPYDNALPLTTLFYAISSDRFNACAGGYTPLLSLSPSGVENDMSLARQKSHSGDVERISQQKRETDGRATV